MAATRESLTEVVETGHDRRNGRDFDREESGLFAISSREGIGRGLAAGTTLGAAAFAGTLLGLTSSPAFAEAPADIQMLQTSASIENLAVSTYKTALTLPFIGGPTANPVVKAFVETTLSQHAQHAQAFNSAAIALGGRAQNGPDPKYVPDVHQAVTAISTQTPSAGALSVVQLALSLENVATATYVANCSGLTDSNSRKITASIMGVEAQHVATLYAVQALLKGGAAQLIALSPTVVDRLPAAAGSVGFPNPFYPTTQASPASEGALS
jgi:hypothetical protein